MTENHLTFVPFLTFIDPQFWNEVNRMKVDEWQLDNLPKSVKAIYYTCKFQLFNFQY